MEYFHPCVVLLLILSYVYKDFDNQHDLTKHLHDTTMNPMAALALIPLLHSHDAYYVIIMCAVLHQLLPQFSFR